VRQNGDMPYRVPLAAVLILLSGLLWAALVLFGTSPWEAGAASLVTMGFVIEAAVLVVAMLLSPGRWVRIALTAIGAGWALTALLTPINFLWGLALATGAAGMGLAWTRPLDEWFHPVKPDRVPTKATVLTLGLVWIPGITGRLGAPEVTAGSWILVGFGLVAGWAYARAVSGSLWVVRLGLLPLGILASLGLAPWAATVLLAATAVLTYLAWTPDARMATEPPQPRRGKPVSILPEVTPPGLMETAGYSRSGRPLEEPD